MRTRSTSRWAGLASANRWFSFTFTLGEEELKVGEKKDGWAIPGPGLVGKIVPVSTIQCFGVMAVTANEPHNSYFRKKRRQPAGLCRCRTTPKPQQRRQANRREPPPFPRESAFRSYIAASALERSSFIVSAGIYSAKPMEAFTRRFIGPDFPATL
jgi:hypothetical protein